MFSFFSSKSKILLCVLLTVFVSNVFSQTEFTKTLTENSPTLNTNKSIYRTDETVQINGERFLSFERVSFEIKAFNTSLNQNILIDRFDIYADQKGRLAAEWDINDNFQTGTRYEINAKGNYSGITVKRIITTDQLAGEAVSISQCANSNVTPQNLDCPNGGPTGWVTGIVGSSKAKHFEGDSIAYRAVLSGLDIGDVYKWTVRYDTSKSGLNAIDYLTTFNRTITNANPCQDGANANGFCTAGAADSTFAIPVDPNVTNGRDVTNGTSDDISQIAGNISGWGVTITNVSVPTYTGTFPGGDSTASVDITFTATSTNAVIAWGGHISTRTDWGQAFGSVNISGAPYHTSNGGLMNITEGGSCCGGSQDLQLQATAVTPSARIVIIKHATPPSPQVFGFSTTNLSPSTFSLVDNSVSTDPMQVFDNINTFNLKTITETDKGSYDLVSINCTVDVGTGGTPAPVRVGDSIQIDIKSGDVVTCTFNNDFVTAAAVSVGGRVFDSNGNGLSRAMITVTDLSGSSRAVMTNQFGYYYIDQYEAGETLSVTVNHKSHTFSPAVITVNESITDLNFEPSP